MIRIIFYRYWNLKAEIRVCRLHIYPYPLIHKTSQPGPSAARDEKFLRVPIGTFYISQTIFSHDPLRFWSLEYPGVRGSGWRGQTWVKSLSRVGVEVCAKFGGDWSGGSRVNEGHRKAHKYKQSVLYICIDEGDGLENCLQNYMNYNFFYQFVTLSYPVWGCGSKALSSLFLTKKYKTQLSTSYDSTKIIPHNLLEEEEYF